MQIEQGKHPVLSEDVIVHDTYFIVDWPRLLLLASTVLLIVVVAGVLLVLALRWIQKPREGENRK